MELFLLTIAWCWLALGLIAGAVIGMRFDREDWLGGYGSWPRRMMRLGHVAFFGTGMIALALALSSPHVGGLGPWEPWLPIPLVIGMVGMPAVCFLSAWRRCFRYLFFIPVVCLMFSVGLVAVLFVRQMVLATGRG